jgi:hypothetical protein
VAKVNFLFIGKTTNKVIFGIFSCQNSQKQFKENLQDFGMWFLVDSQNIEKCISLKFYFQLAT